MVNNWTNNANTYSIHKNYLVQLAILESLLMHGSIDLKELPLVIFRRLRGNDKITWTTTPHYVIDRMVYLERLGYVTVEGEIVNITFSGIEALRNGSPQNIAAATFFNSFSAGISRASIAISIIAIFISIVACVITYKMGEKEEIKNPPSQSKNSSLETFSFKLLIIQPN